MTIPTSEALMETFGSIMETYHGRFSNGDPKFDDTRLQKEMFLKLNGPPLIVAEPFFKKILEKYRAEGGHRFAHEQTHLARLTASSLTVKRLQREAASDSSRTVCIEFS